MGFRVTQVAKSTPIDNTTDYLAATNVQEAIDEIKGTNVVIVNPTGSGVIAAAIAAITTATSTNQFVIKVMPGSYTEPQLVMKNFVSIHGLDMQSVIINAQDPTNHLVIGAAATLRYLTIKGVTTAGKAGVYSTASGFQMRNCVVRDNPINILVEGVGSLASITAEDLIVTGSFTTGIHIKNNGAGVQGVFKNSIINAVGASSGAKCGICEGASVSFIFTSLVASGVTTVNGLSAFNGATLKILGAEMKSFAKAIWLENSGSAPVIDVMAINLDSNTADIQIDHATATGAVQGIITRSKITNAAPNGVQLVYQDPANGDFNVTRILATRGFASEVKSVSTTNGTVQLVSTDQHKIYVTGSTTGTIIAMPDATTLRVGHEVEVINEASVFITTQQYGGSNSIQVNSDFSAHYVLLDNSTQAGVWFDSVLSTISAVFDPQVSSAVLYDDFNNMFTWSPSTSGSGASASVSSGNAAMASGKHMGVAELVLGAVVPSTAALVQSSTLSTATVFGNGQAEYQSLIYIPTLATSSDDFTFRAGMGTSTTADHANGIYFEYNRGVSTNWILKTASQSVRTSTTSSIAVTAGAWILLRWFVNSAGTSVTFLIDNVLAGTNTTNIPTVTGQGCGPNFQLTRVAILSGTRNVYMDYFYFLKQFTARN